MADITFIISGGTPNYTVSIEGYVGVPNEWVYVAPGEYTISAGDFPVCYTLNIIDGGGCVASDEGCFCPTTTTTSTTGEITTTTTTTLEATTTTTTIEPTTTTTTTQEVTTTSTTTCEDGIINYGAIYNWWAVTDIREFAPSGWHVPSKTEIETLTTYLGGVWVAGGPMKEIGNDHWDFDNVGATNSSGFTGRGSGWRDADGTYYEFREYFFMWTSTLIGSTRYNYRLNTWTEDFQEESGLANDMVGFSIRLIKDDDTDPGTVTGNDGTIYNTVKIGNQVWMAENSCETEYRNNDKICFVQDDIEWSDMTIGAMCAYDNYNDYVSCSFPGGIPCPTTSTTTMEPTTTTSTTLEPTTTTTTTQESTTTSTTTIEPTTTTSTTTEEVTTTTTTTQCRPLELIDGVLAKICWNDEDPHWDFQHSSVEDACSAFYYFHSGTQGGVTTLDMEYGELQIGESLFAQHGLDSCTYVVDGYYWWQSDDSNSLVYFRYNVSDAIIVTVVDGLISDIHYCTTTTTTTLP